MNFDNEQAAISQKYVVCVRVKRLRIWKPVSATFRKNIIL